MQYDIEIYEINDDNSCRFALGKLSPKTLFVIGVNPSTADDKEPDKTIRKVMGFAERNGYESFIMFNLYPLRSTDPKSLPKEPDESIIARNINEIEKIIQKSKSLKIDINILLAWGEVIYSRPYLINCLQRIDNALSKYQVSYCRIGSLLKNSNQPRHPSRAPYYQLENMDLKDCSKK